MKKSRLAICVLFSLVGVSGVANAKGCLTGAAVGGVAGHVAGHHGVIGAAAGCAVGHHRAKVKDEKAAAAVNQTRQPNTLPAPVPVVQPNSR